MSPLLGLSFWHLETVKRYRCAVMPFVLNPQNESNETSLSVEPFRAQLEFNSWLGVFSGCMQRLRSGRASRAGVALGRELL
eukprot:2429241-Amphidinium_carterae.1